MVEKREMPTEPAGDRKTIRQAILETGSGILQDFTPVKQFDIYVVGFHPSKDDPTMQMEAHHYCKPVNRDFLQRVGEPPSRRARRGIGRGGGVRPGAV